MGVEWQPIETAPKDGTFTVYIPGCRVYHDVENWLDSEFKCFFSDRYGRLYDPSHWMPDPPPPTLD